MDASMSAVASLMSLPTDRRAEKRVSQCFKVNFKVLHDNAALGAFAAIEQRNSSSAATGPRTDKIQVWAQNASFGGLGITGDLDLMREGGLQADSFLEMELEVPLVARKLRCVGSVAWVKSDQASGTFRAGVKFL